MNDQTGQEFQNETHGCEQFEKDLARYLEGEVAPSVSAHAGVCPFCRVVLADLEQVRFAARRLPQAEPPARIWANLRAALAQEGLVRSRRRAWPAWLERFWPAPSPAPLAALAALAIVTAIIAPPVTRDWNKVPAPPVQIASAITQHLGGADEKVLVERIGEMEESYRARRAQMDPAVRAVYQKSLESLDDSIKQCSSEPDNDLAQEYKIAAYEQKAEVLEAALEFESR